MNKSATKQCRPPSELFVARIKALDDWRGECLSLIRALIVQACPEVIEEVKWRKPSNPMGVPVWSCEGLICTGETYKGKVKLTFAYGASLADPDGLFNGDDKGQTRRSIDIREGDQLVESAFMSLVRAATDYNRHKSTSKTPGGRGTKPSKAETAKS
jgi:hypothetical protein